MANVKTYNLSVYFTDNTSRTFRGISRVAVKQYLEFYRESNNYEDYLVEER